MRKDIICCDCKKEEAFYLLFWKKIYKDMGEAYLDPSIVCERCAKKFLGSLKLFERRPVLMSFRELRAKKQQYIGYILSPKGKACNHLSFPFWRKKIWRIRYLGTPKKKGD